MSDYKKPLPEIEPWSRPFWEGAKRHELLLQQCADCGRLLMYPKMCCFNCLTSNFKWVKASGKGKVYTFSIIHAYPPSAFLDDLPYVVAVIRLEEGVQMMSNIIGCAPEDVKCDMDVEVVFDDVTEQFTLPKFKPASP